jgi:hypothetical protein
MRTIRARGTVGVDRKLIVDVPPDIAPGEHQVVVFIDDAPGERLPTTADEGRAHDSLIDERRSDLKGDGGSSSPSQHSPTVQPDLLRALGLTAVERRAWPRDATFRRDEIYTDDDR